VSLAVQSRLARSICAGWAGLALVLTTGCGEPPPPPAPPAPLDLEAELDMLEAVRASGERSDRPEAAAAAGEADADTLAVGARLIDASFRPLAQGELVWCEADPYGLPVERARASADANGTLWLTLPRTALAGDGPLFLASAPGCVRRLLGSGTARLSGATINLGEVQLAPAGELAGRVRDEAGRPLADARVWLGELAADAAQAEPELARFYPELAPLDGWLVGVSDADGNFALSNVPPGSWDLLVLASPAAERRLPALARVTVEAGARAAAGELVLGAPAAGELLHGTVRGAGGAHARLLLVPANGRMLPRLVGGMADLDGRFSLLVPAATSWVVEARDAEGQFAPVRSEVVTGGDTFELVLGD